MDFHSLTRKELQALCKLNKIPANITNVAMADSLAALQHVEGLEEFLNQSQSEPQNFDDTIVVIGSPEAPRTSCRTSTRTRKQVNNKEAPESSQPMTRTRRAMKNPSSVEETEVADPESREVPLKTPSAAITRRRVPPASAAKKTETQKDEIGTVQRAYSTRRSVRLLEQTLENLSLSEDVKIGPVKIGDFLTDTDEKEASFEGKEDLNMDEVQLELNNNSVQDERKAINAHEAKDSELESELKDFVEASDEKMDMMDETLGDEVDRVSIAEISNEVENPIFKESQTDDIDAVEVSDEVKEIADETIPSEQSNLEVSERVLKEPSNEKDSENLVNPSTEEKESSKLEALIEKSLPKDSTFLANNGSELDVTEEEIDTNSSEEEEEEEEEEEFDGDSSGEEEECSETEVSDEESADSDEVDVESEESDFESGLVDVKVVEAQIAIPSIDSHSRSEFEFVSEPKESSLVDAVIVQAEEKKTLNGGSVSGSKTGPKTPFSAYQLSGQFPRPTPTKSSSKKAHPIIDIIANILDEKETEPKNEENDNGDNTKLCTKSLRELQKMLKTKLKIENDKKEEKKRIALQTLSENQIGANEN